MIRSYIQGHPPTGPSIPHYIPVQLFFYLFYRDTWHNSCMEYKNIFQVCNKHANYSKIILLARNMPTIISHISSVLLKLARCLHVLIFLCNNYANNQNHLLAYLGTRLAYLAIYMPSLNDLCNIHANKHISEQTQNIQKLSRKTSNKINRLSILNLVTY